MWRKVFVVGVIVAASVAVTWLLLANRRPVWTTRSDAARQAFEQGLEAQGKIYYTEAYEHFTKALAADPDFVMARLFQLLVAREARVAETDRAGAIAQLEKTDATRLSPRERFLLNYHLRLFKRDAEGAEKVLEAYLTEAPQDPFALDLLGRRQVSRRDWAAAEETFRRLARLAPNRVEAYNQLGYIALARGDFAEAERMFRTYKYLAPDQANPHDSLAELLMLTGRYEEARGELEQALANKPDFCVAFQHMVSLGALAGSMDGIDEVVERARLAGCEETLLARMRCQIRLWRAVHGQDWEAAWQVFNGECSNVLAEDALRFTAAIHTGRRTEAETLLAKYSQALEKEPPSFKRSVLLAVSSFMQGQADLLAERFAEAAQHFAEADAHLTFRAVDDGGLFKLFTRHFLYRALRGARATARAASLLAEIRAVNPPFAELTERGSH